MTQTHRTPCPTHLKGHGTNPSNALKRLRVHMMVRVRDFCLDPGALKYQSEEVGIRGIGGGANQQLLSSHLRYHVDQRQPTKHALLLPHSTHLVIWVIDQGCPPLALVIRVGFGWGLPGATANLLALGVGHPRGFPLSILFLVPASGFLCSCRIGQAVCQPVRINAWTNKEKELGTSPHPCWGW